VPRVLRFFLSGIFGIFSPRLRIDPQPEPAARGSGATPRGLRFSKSHFLDGSGFKTRQAFLKTFEGRFQGRLGLLEKTSRLLKHQLEYIPASGCFDYS
jgi:hypothetical protein